MGETTLNTKELYSYTGNKDQLYGVRRITLEEGAGKGITIYDVTTAGGLQFDITADNGLDIGRLRYKGTNISYLSKNGYTSPDRFDPFENDFLHTFPGGMLYTCGLRSVGPANRDGDEWHPLHGRYHSIPAVNQYAFIEDDKIVIGGEIYETALFGHILRIKRKITVPVWSSEIYLEDVLENLTPQTMEYMLLYHWNFGYPMLSEQAKLTLPEKRKTTPRTDYAKKGLGKECEFSSPIDGEQEQVYFHEMNDARVLLKNSALKIGAEFSWSVDTLPILGEWKSMASGDYVLGIEPSNCYVMGRNAERANGTIKTIGAFEKRTMTNKLVFKNI
jgi:hypothetical protein